MSYITHTDEDDTDLLLGDLGLSSKIDVDMYMHLAFDEMTVLLGRCYATPLPDIGDLGADDLKHLKFCQQTLATGYIYLAQAGAMGNDTLNAYGERMLELGNRRIDALCEQGVYALTTVALRPILGSGPGGADWTGNTPIIVNYDGESAVESYMAFTHGRRSVPWDWGDGDHGYAS